MEKIENNNIGSTAGFSLTNSTLERINNLLICCHEFSIRNDLASKYNALNCLFKEVITLQTKTNITQKEFIELDNFKKELEEEFDCFQMRSIANQDAEISEEKIKDDYNFPKKLDQFEILIRIALSKKKLLMDLGEDEERY